MNAIRRWSVASICAAGLLAANVSVGATLVFDFNDNASGGGTPFDGAGSGATMTATTGTESVTMTSVDVLAPEYDANFAATGNTLSAASGGGVTTNVGGVSSNALGINNPSISNTGFGTAGGSTDAGGESANFNLDEAWVIEFDKPVIFSLFDFSSMGGGDAFEVTIEDFGTASFPDNGSADDYADPFGGLIIPAGKDVTFRATGVLADLGIRITEIHVKTIPEPASCSLLVIGLVAAAARRRK